MLASLKILIRTPKGEQQEIIFRANVQNDGIELAKILFDIENTINKAALNIRAHAAIGD
jgi:hypothetical protein